MGCHPVPQRETGAELSNLHLQSFNNQYVENSPKLESDAHSLWICHFTSRNDHFKMESRSNYKAASSVAHRRDI